MLGFGVVVGDEDDCGVEGEEDSVLVIDIDDGDV